MNGFQQFVSQLFQTVSKQPLSVLQATFNADIEWFEHPLTGQVEIAIAPHQRGRVHCQGTYWPARFYYGDCQLEVKPEDFVKVVGREGITLLVVPLG